MSHVAWIFACHGGHVACGREGPFLGHSETVVGGCARVVSAVCPSQVRSMSSGGVDEEFVSEDTSAVHDESPAKHEPAAAVETEPMPVPVEEGTVPPVLPRRPSIAARRKLRQSLNLGSQSVEDTSSLVNDSVTPAKTSDDPSNRTPPIPAVAAASPRERSISREEQRKIFFGNRLLLFASTQHGGYFLGSDADGYAILSEAPRPTCFTNMSTVPYIRYGDVIRINAGNCGVHGHVSNSWMSWSADVSKPSGLFTVSPPDLPSGGSITKHDSRGSSSDLLLSQDTQFGKPLEYGSPFMLVSAKWKTNVVGVTVHKNVKHLALNTKTKSWLEPLVFMCQVYKPQVPRESRSPSISFAELAAANLGKQSPPPSPLSARGKTVTSTAPTEQKTAPESAQDEMNDPDLAPNIGKFTGVSAFLKKTKANKFGAVEKKTAVNFAVGNVLQIQKQLNERASSLRDEWLTELKGALKSKLAEKEVALGILEEEMNALAGREGQSRSGDSVAVGDAPSVDISKEHVVSQDDAPSFEAGDLFVRPSELSKEQSTSAEFLEIEKMVNDARVDIAELKLKLYCPSAMGFRYRFQAYGYFCGMNDYAFEQLSIPYKLSFQSATDTRPASIVLEFSPVTITWKAFGLKLVTESHAGIKQSTRDFKELTINASMVLNMQLYFTTEADFEYNGLRPDNSKKGHPPAKDIDASTPPCYAWYCKEYKFEVVKTMNENGIEGGVIPTLVKKVANYYFPKIVKDYILWYITMPLGTYLKDTPGQSFHAEGKIDISGTRLDVLKAKFMSNKWGIGSKTAKSTATDATNPATISLALLGGLSPVQAELLCKLRDVIGKSHGDSWEGKWDSLHALKTYIHHMDHFINIPEEWRMFVDAWQALANVVYPPIEETGEPVLNMHDIFRRVRQISLKPVEASWSIRSLNGRFDFNTFTVMQRDVAEWAINQSLSSDSDDDKNSTQNRLSTTRGLLALREVQKWHKERLDTIEFLSTVLPKASASLAVTLSGGSKGMLSIYSKQIDARVPRQLQLQLGKTAMAPSIDSTVLTVTQQGDGGRYNIEYCSPITIEERERAVSTSSSQGKDDDSMTRDRECSVGSEKDLHLSSLTENMFGKSNDFPGHVRVLVISWKDADVSVKVDRDKLVKRLQSLPAEAGPFVEISNIHFALDGQNSETYRLSAMCPEESVVDISVSQVRIAGSPARITQYYQETMRKAKLAEAESSGQHKSNASGGGLSPGQNQHPDVALSDADEWYQNVLLKIRKYASSPELSLDLFVHGSLHQDTEDGHIHVILEGSPRKSSRPNNITPVNNRKTPGDSGEDGIVASANIALCIEELVRDFGLREREHEI